MLTRLKSTPWLAEIIALLAAIAYIIQTWVYTHTRASILDEGAYLYKGYLFVTGQYRIYQDYGTWSNHMPLSFYIPGYIQLIFGPGLRTGRYFAILISVLTLIGLWILVRRIGGRWWATAAVLVVTINPVLIKMYSVTVSQVLIACMLVWTLVLVLGEKRSLWEIGLGSFIAGAMMMTRINLTPVLPLLILYVFWQHGHKAGLVSATIGGLTVLIGHALFWPGILRMWAFWTPDSLTPFLDPWRPPTDALPSWDPSVDALGRLNSFFQSYRVSFIALVGALTTWLLWPRKSQWKVQSDLRSAVFLSILFLTLLFAHMWATLVNNYCVFCLPGYTTFFTAAGFALVVISMPSWRKELPWWHQLIVVTIILVISAGIGFGAFEDVDDALLDLKFPKFVFGYPITSGSERLGKLLYTTYEYETKLLRRVLPTLAGLLVGILIVIMAFIACTILDRDKNAQRNIGYWALLLFLITGALLSATRPLGGGYRFYECEGNVIESYEDAGRYLNSVIPPGSQVYWDGGQSTAPLLYLPDIKIYPPQLNSAFSFYIGEDSDALARFGFWNEDLAQQWLEESDIILVQQRNYRGWIADELSTGPFQELEATPPTEVCNEGSQIRVFTRKQ